MPSKKTKGTILLLTSVVLVATGQILLKYGLNKAGALNFQAQLWESFLAIASVPWVWIGIIFFASSSLFWILGMSKSDLSFAYPLMSVAYATVAILSWLLFNESLGVLRIFGIVIIVLGVLMLSKS